MKTIDFNPECVFSFHPHLASVVFSKRRQKSDQDAKLKIQDWRQFEMDTLSKIISRRRSNILEFTSPAQKGWYYLIKYTLIVFLVLFLFEVILDFIPIGFKDGSYLPTGHVVVLSLTLIYVLVGFIAIARESFILSAVYSILMSIGVFASMFTIQSKFESPQIIASYILASLVNFLSYVYASILYKVTHAVNSIA